MQKLYLTICLLIIPLMLIAQYKSEYDIKENSLQKSAGVSAVQNSQIISNGVLEATMLEGGYFTLGTATGLSESVLDNNCDITYGHPYAKTSYPFYSIDAQMYKLEDLFSWDEINSPIINGDTITIAASNSMIDIRFSLVLQENGQSVKLVTSVTNLDTLEHSVSAGFIFDPALGKWGDGYAKLNNEFIGEELLTSTDQVSNLELWERRTGAQGMGLNIDFQEDDPAQVCLLNWSFAKDFNPYLLANYELISLYDLTLFYNADSLLQPGESLEREVNFTLLQPDFNTPLFTRWDMVQAITINDGIIFPNSMTTTLEVFNTTETDQTVMNIGSEIPSYIRVTPAAQHLTIPANSYNYLRVYTTTKIVYENKIADMALWLDGDTETLDIVNRSMFIPQTPVSDEGLTIVDDSIATFNHPDIDVVFSVENDETGVRIRNLTEENVFLYENGVRIEEFELSKYTGDGINEADIVFVLDVTGSMGNEIDGVKENIRDFASNLELQGIDYRLGLVTFLDVIENTYSFTNDVEAFRDLIAQQYAHGGGDGPENSLDALSEAAEFEFRPQAKRTIVWITDADFHESDGVTQLSTNEVVNKLLQNGIVVHCIGNESFRLSEYDKIIIPTGGDYYNIYGDFEDIFLELSNMESGDRFILEYSSANNMGEYSVDIQIRYAGLGGNKTFTYMLQPPEANKNDKRLDFFPNPFNPTITFNVDLQNYRSGTISIYNILGQLVKEYHLNSLSSNAVTWNAVNEFGQLVSTGFYLVQLSLLDSKNNSYTETAKILYLK